MSWVKLLSGLLALFRQIGLYLAAKDNQELGRLKEKERQDEANNRIVADINSADPDSVPDDEIIRR